jgi:hypothetical protein
MDGLAESMVRIIEPVANVTRHWPTVLPTPLSPLFLPGGRFDFVNEDVAMTIFFMLVLGVIDALIVRPCIHPKARYFALHVVANSISSYAAFPDVYRALVTDPLNSFQGASATMAANSAVAAIHLYHIVAFTLRWDDIFHHLTFVSVLCGLAVPFKQSGGAANNLGCFFLSGLPGALNYVFLILYYHGFMSRATEKLWTARVNVWLRGPAMSVYLFLGAQAILRGTYQTPLWALLVVIGLHFTNGQYYAQQAVESLTRYNLAPKDDAEDGAAKKKVDSGANGDGKKRK